MHYQIFDTETTLTFEVMPPLYHPYFNNWGLSTYVTYEPFTHDPFTMDADCTSGSPVILTCEKFFGFMNLKGGTFSYDGAYRLTVTCPAGQGLWVNEDCSPYAEWRAYSEAVLATLPPAQKNEDFWGGLEYCTWVDQKHRAAELGIELVQNALTQDYVYEYMRRVDRMKLPHGKLTIDDGWDLRYNTPDGRACYGNWVMDTAKFPDMPRLVKDMKAEGFFPGLWFAPYTITANCELAKKHPHVLGKLWPGDVDEPTNRALRFVSPEDEPLLEDYYRGIFEPYVDMGFLKFKMDMSYGNRDQMLTLSRIMHKVIKELNPAVEIEGHIADVFTSRYYDTIRLNDVSFENGNWRAITTEHYKVCHCSAPDKILNFDHVGTNTPCPAEEDYLKHARMLCRMRGGYPCMSLLPDVFGEGAIETIREELTAWERACR